MVTSITAEEAYKLKDALYIDVREKEELQRTGVIPGTRHMPLRSIELAPEGAFDELPKDRPLITVCARGFRSLKGAELMVAHGLTVRSLVGGLEAWMALDYPLEKMAV